MTAGETGLADIPQGHDTWVVGDEPFVVIDWISGDSYGRAAARGESG